MASKALLGWLGRGGWYPDVLQKLNNLAHDLLLHFQATPSSPLQYTEVGIEVVWLDLQSQSGPRAHSPWQDILPCLCKRLLGKTEEAQKHTATCMLEVS